MSSKLVGFQASNVKRINLVEIQLDANSMTIIGGNNNQGKTSVLDSIAFAMGGGSFKPSNITNTEATDKPYIRLELDNGIVIERTGKDCNQLKINGNPGKQADLEKLYNNFALDLGKFINSKDTEKAKILLDIIGLEPELNNLDQIEADLEQDRLLTGREYERARKFADGLNITEDPGPIFDPSELVKQLQTALSVNAENDKVRQSLSDYRTNITNYEIRVDNFDKHIASLMSQIEDIKRSKAETVLELEALNEWYNRAKNEERSLVDVNDAEIKKQMAEAEDHNVKVRDYLNFQASDDKAIQLKDAYNALDAHIAEVRNSRMQLLHDAKLPLPGLSIVDKKVVYNGQLWDCMSGSQQLIVAAAITKELNKNCGFVLLDKAEQMDLKTLQEFAEWCKGNDLQIIATRVSTSDECSIIIEAGQVKENRLLKGTPAVVEEIDEW